MRRNQKSLAAVLAAVLLLALPLVAVAQTPGTPGPAGPGESGVTSGQAGDGLVIVPVAVGPEGSAAVYIAAYSVTVSAGSRTGMFADVPGEAVGEQVAYAVRARVEVLSVDAAAGTARVSVQAQPVDPETREPLSDRVWEGVYLLAEDEAVLEAGTLPPDEYVDLVRPVWLTDWIEARISDLPEPPLRVGQTWQSSVVNEDLAELGVPGGEVVVFGQFAGWVDAAGVGGPVAHLVERLESRGAAEESVAEGITARTEYVVSGENNAWLVPGDFLAGSASIVDVDMVMHMGAPELGGGDLQILVHLERAVEREAGDSLLAWTAPELPVLEIGGTVTGFLGEGSQDYGDGTYADYYLLYGQEGDELALRLLSQDFDAYLELRDDAWQVVAWGDDTDGSTDAAVFVTLPYTGLYYVVANSYFAESGGNYTLTVTRESAPTRQAADAAAVIDAISALLPALQDVRSMSDEDLSRLEDSLLSALSIIWEEQARRSED